MVAFDPGTDPGRDVAFRLMADGFVTLFRRHEVLADTVAWLVAHGYRVVRLDASRWASEADLHRDVARALDLPASYGANLDALNDCLRDVEAYGYGSSVATTGLILVFDGYHRFAARCPGPAQAVLDIVAVRARSAALVGHRMLCLVQSDDPDIGFAPVGATPVSWNPAEWPRAARRPD